MDTVVLKFGGSSVADNIKLNIVDLPGIYSLSPYTPEEIISRNYVIDEKPDCIINIVDATNLERNLYLTTQLLEIDVPVVIALNMIDSVTNDGDSINKQLLEKNIKVPVIEISALKEHNIHELMKIVSKEHLFIYKQVDLIRQDIQPIVSSNWLIYTVPLFPKEESL